MQAQRLGKYLPLAWIACCPAVMSAQPAENAVAMQNNVANTVAGFCNDMEVILTNHEKRTQRAWTDHLQYIELARPLVEGYPVDVILRSHDHALSISPANARHRAAFVPRLYCGAVALVADHEETVHEVTRWVKEGNYRDHSSALFVALSYAPIAFIRKSTEELILEASPQGPLSAEEASLAGSLLAMSGDEDSLKILEEAQRHWPDFRTEGGMNGPPLSSFPGDGQIFSGDIAYLKKRIDGKGKLSVTDWNELELSFFRWTASGPPESARQSDHSDGSEVVDRVMSYSVQYPIELLRTKSPKGDAEFFEGYTIGTSLAAALARHDKRLRQTLQAIPNLWRKATANDRNAVDILLTIEDRIVIEELRDAIGDNIRRNTQSLNEAVIRHIARLGGEENKMFLLELSRDERLSEHERNALANAAASIHE